MDITRLATSILQIVMVAFAITAFVSLYRTRGN
jgi:hypothetical protein